MYSKYKILVTRPLSDEQTAYANALGLEPVIEPALRVEFTENLSRIVRKLEKHPDARWIFTSRNAVEVLKRIQGAGYKVQGTGFRAQGAGRKVSQREDDLNFLKVYAVGEKTADALREIGIEAEVPDQQDAVGLAELIKSKTDNTGDAKRSEFIHWCGNRRRDELKNGLQEAGLEFVEMEVYRTELNKISIPEDVGEAILFYSPSAVEAFRKSGGFEQTLPELFAIGNTTGEALSMESGKTVHIPVEPSAERLLELVAEVLGTRGNSGARSQNSE